MASFGNGGLDEPKPEEEHQRNTILNQMLDLFMDSFEIEVIQTVLESYEFDYEQSKRALESMKDENKPKGTSSLPLPQPLPSPQPLLQPRHPEHQRVQHANLRPVPLAASPRPIPLAASPRPVPLAQLVGSSPSKSQQSPSRSVQPPVRNPTDPTLDRIHEYIRNGNKILVLMRGCAGAGKSHLAAQLLQLCGGERSDHVFSSDDYFMRNGRYNFNPQELQLAHKSNQDNVLRAIRNGYSPVIVDNTNTQSWEMQVYVIMAVNHGYAVETLEPQTPWKFNYNQLIKKNIHNVPPASIRAMLERYEHGLKGEDIIRQLKLHYPPSKYPPQPARRTANRRPEPAAEPLPAKPVQKAAPLENFAPLPPTVNPSAQDSQPISKILEQGPSTTQVQSPFQFSFGNPGPLRLGEISLLQVANAFQSILNTSNPKTCDPPPDYSSIDTAASKIAETREDLIDLSTPPDVVGASQGIENNRGEPVIWGWGTSWEDVENKEESKKSTDQRDRWLLLDKKGEETADESALGATAESFPVEWGQHEPAPCDKEDFAQRKQFVSPAKQDNSSNTNYQDFQLILENAQLPDGMRLLACTSRDINANLVNYVPPIPKKIVVDVSSMTDNECGGRVEGSLSELRRLFPLVSVGNLETLLETCNGDVNWASNCLLDTESGVRLDTASLPQNRPSSPEVPSLEMRSSEVPEPESADSSCSDVTLQDQKPSSSFNRSQSQDSLILQSDESVVVRRCSSVPLVSDPLVTPVAIKPLREVPEYVHPLTPKKKCPYPSSSEDEVPETSDESEASSQEEDEMLEFVISSEFSQQLFSRFGGPQNKVKKSGHSPVLRIPDSIAHQIHYYLILSQEYYAEENGEVSEEDEEEFPGLDSQDKIDQELYNEMIAHKPMSRQEQEDMELATSIYEMDLAAVYNSKETMASVLTRKLLQDSFPTLDPKLLDELMEVHGNSYHKTREMIQEHYMNSYTVKQKDFPALNKSQQKTPSRSRLDYPDRLRGKTETDEELQIARIYKQKAQEQSAKREWSAAAVYSQMAKIHKRQHNRYIARTVQRVYADNMRSYCPSSLDLHFLLVDQALVELDDFLDEHILSLADQPSKTKSLYIITGRGKHSLGGIPKIRPAVLQRLEEREIESKLENPGLVRVEISGRSLLSSDCDC